MLTGSVSRSTDTARVHRLSRDGHATEADFRSAVGRDAREILAAQKSFAFVSSGQLDWLDALRPLAKRFNGFAVRESPGEDAVGPVTRWLRTDTFYRKPLVNGRVDCTGDELARMMPTTGADSVIFLPAPYSFVRMVENSFYGSEEELAMDYARAVAKGTHGLREKGYGCVLLAEPFVGFEQSKGRHSLPDWFAKAISEAKSPEMRLGINFPLANSEEFMSQVDQSTADFIGIDAAFSSDFKIDTGKDVLMGVVDGARPSVEDVAVMERRVKDFVSKASFSGRYYIGPNDRLYDVPFDIGLRKINSLAQFRGIR
jgi:methionine synthase II (cobalamin-independent)